MNPERLYIYTIVLQDNAFKEKSLKEIFECSFWILFAKKSLLA